VNVETFHFVTRTSGSLWILGSGLGGLGGCGKDAPTRALLLCLYDAMQLVNFN
jgi:hypothetical protein